MAIRAIVMQANDNVATVVEPIAPHTDIEIPIGETTMIFQVREAIPFGHKFALRDIDQGGRIIKYGEVIGLATQPIQAGRHVHVHNIESCRGRGDR